ncbi:hypothetical protein HFN_0603 [Helicobacter fennelliae MRY12-0050]|uniref:Uncharacterized protein n=1 Tax=Helicobacter fennelliae MRY12-0050 TaxID=1325130 RepID=T1DUH7_9HELI|nr:hypothetical protein HFN_0603 [Helicobacter fennelliae MRY12-0050]
MRGIDSARFKILRLDSGIILRCFTLNSLFVFMIACLF